VSDIQIIIPLSVLGTASSLTPEEISRTLNNATAYQQAAERYRELVNVMVVQFQSAARDLLRILDEVDDPWHRVQALRQLAADMQEAAQNTREIP